MLIQRKLRQPSPGEPKLPLIRLKELAAEERARVMHILRANTYEQALSMVEQIVGFNCSIDTLKRFFAWQQTGQAMELSDEMIGQIGDFLRERYPGWSEEKMRETASAFFTFHTMSQRDTRGFACIARLGLESGREQILADKLKFDKEKTARKLALNAKRLELDKLKFEHSQSRKLDIALDALAEDFKKNPEALKLYRVARQKLEAIQGED